MAKDKKQVLIRLKPETKRMLKIIAAKNESSVSAMLEELIEASLVVKPAA